MTKYTVYALNAQGQVIGTQWTYNKTEIKGIALYFKKFTFAAGVKVNGKIWMF